MRGCESLRGLQSIFKSRGDGIGRHTGLKIPRGNEPPRERSSRSPGTTTLFMEFPYGTLETSVPPEFVPAEVWPEYGYIAAPPSFCRREHIEGDYRALRWSLWPLCFEQHIGDAEPDLEKSKKGNLAYNRLATWHRVCRTDVPTGWHGSAKPYRVDGYKMLNGDIMAGWRKNTRRDLRLWQELHAGKTHAIERIDIAEYDHAYRKSIIAKRVNLDRLKELSRRMQLPGFATHVELWGVRNLSTNNVIAGTGVIISPTYRGSTHIAPFILEEGRLVFAATALIHHWFFQAKERGDKFVMTTNFWLPGKPKGWKGFSEFKSHFGWQYISYPPELWRFVRGKLF